MDASEFEKRFGSAPTHDDLVRVNCASAGQAGHSSCGVCDLHNAPRFGCGCTLPLCGAVMPRTSPEGLFRCALPNGHKDVWHRAPLGSADGQAVWRDG